MHSYWRYYRTVPGRLRLFLKIGCRNRLRECASGVQVNQESMTMDNQLRPMALRFALAGLVAGYIVSSPARADDIPVSLQVPAGAVLTQKLHASGVQIYSC